VLPTAEDIRATHRSIHPHIHRTPVLTCQTLNRLTDADLYFKCENFQKIGAFKMRGAAAAAELLSEADRAKGLATHSSGNHAQAVARAAGLFGTRAYIVMPENAPAVKVAAVRDYGAEIIRCGNTPQDRESTLEQVVAETGATFIHPYNNYGVIRGQATCAKEMIEDADVAYEILMAPVGGGGLLSGTALSARYFSPGTTVFGAEPYAVDDAYRSLQAGSIQYNETTDTIADGLRTPLGDKTFGIIREHVAAIIRVEEETIVEAMRLIWERMKIVIEPSCAVPLAAVLTEPEHFRGKRVGIILTGGNVDLGALPF
jgi:threonine dehydratase